MSENIVNNPNWWPHRYDSTRDAVHFIKASKEDHRSAVFLTDEYLKGASDPKPVDRKFAASTGNQVPLHFIFHSAYCCSTLLTRAFDIPGISMGLKEPVILNDMEGSLARGAVQTSWETVSKDLLSLLARPLEAHETIIAKPSSLINNIAPQIMAMRPDSRALFLYAPLEDYLGSIARKGMWGRLWVRDLMIKQLRHNLIHLGLQGDDYLGLTDLQTAAVGWLVQHAIFAHLYEQYGAERLLFLDSVSFMKHPKTALDKLSNHFGLKVSTERLTEIVTGPVFNTHSKTDEDFDMSSREADRNEGEQLHSDEIEKVYIWAQAVADNARIPLNFPVLK